MYPYPLEMILMNPYGYRGSYDGPTLSEIALAALPACGGDAKKALEAARLIHEESRTEEKRKEKKLKELDEQITKSTERLEAMRRALDDGHLAPYIAADLKEFVAEQRSKGEGKVPAKTLEKALSVVFDTHLAWQISKSIRERMNASLKQQDKVPLPDLRPGESAAEYVERKS